MTRYRIIAYVCESGLVYEVNDEGTSDFGRVYRRNHNGCKFAVVETAGEIRAYDCDTCTFLPDFEAQPGDYVTFPEADAAIVGCVMRNHTTTTGD